jgi:ribosomal protein S18 acetylase RimI-like enzyme
MGHHTMTRSPDVHYRTARDSDVERTYQVFLEASDDLSARVGRPPRAGTGAPPVRALALRRSCVRNDGERFWVAEADGLVVGFAIAILRGDVWHLAALHVAPAHQGSGVGSELLRRSMAGTATTTALTVLTDAVNPISNAIYLRAGMLYQDAMLTFDGPPAERAAARQGTGADGVAFASRPISLAGDQAVLAELDRGSIGFARPVDHDLWASIPGLRSVLFLRDATVHGYAYVSGDGAIGPLAVREARELRPALDLAADLAAAAGASSIHLRIPGSAREAGAWVVERGLRLSGIGLFLTSRHVGRLDRYVTSGGDAFY